jgi:hypothetical protein
MKASMMALTHNRSWFSGERNITRSLAYSESPNFIDADCKGFKRLHTSASLKMQYKASIMITNKNEDRGSP